MTPRVGSTLSLVGVERLRAWLNLHRPRQDGPDALPSQHQGMAMHSRIPFSGNSTEWGISTGAETGIERPGVEVYARVDTSASLWFPSFRDASHRPGNDLRNCRSRPIAPDSRYSLPGRGRRRSPGSERSMPHPGRSARAGRDWQGTRPRKPPHRRRRRRARFARAPW